MSGWSFRDYVNRRGVNEIHTWLHRLPTKARAKINVRISYLSTGALRLEMPYARQLHGECEGLLELRVEYRHVQYRPIGYYGPTRDTVTLLLGAIERNDRFDPPGACATGMSRRLDVESDMERYSCEHDPS